MKTKSIIIAVVLSVAFSSASAVISQKLVLKNGTVLEGYIQSQRPGEKITFNADRSEVLLPGKEVRIITPKEVAYKEVSEEWRAWADDNDAWIGTGDNRKLKLYDLITRKHDIKNVRVLERGARVRYIDMNNSMHTLSWDTIQVLCSDKRNKTMLSGINRIYQLTTGAEFEGQYVEEVPGQTICLYDANGITQVLETDKVAKYTLKKVNPNQSLLEQSDLLDVVVTKNSTMTGVIIERNYGSENNLLIQDQSGNNHIISSDEVVEYRKKPNEAYKPLMDIVLKDGELVINRKSTEELKTTEEKDSKICVEKKDSVLTLEKTNPATTVIVEYNLGTAPSANYVIMKVNEFKAKDKKTPSTYGFTYKDIVESAIKAKEVVTSVNHTTKATFEIPADGYYVVYDQINKKAYPFIIK